MKQSILFTKTAKQVAKDEGSYNAQVLMRAGFIDKVAAGVYSYLPLGLSVINKISTIIRSEMDAIDGQEVLMSALTLKESWQQTGRWENFDTLFKLTGIDDKAYALAATHEEVVTALVKKFVASYKDLPLSLYQIQTKFRKEKRAKSGLIRLLEFIMKDLYSFHASQSDLDAYYDKVVVAYNRIFGRLGLKDITYMTYASGGTFSKYSHEFQVLSEIGEDTIFICDDCHVAVNKEIIAKHNFCPICHGKTLRKEKAIEAGNIFKLGSRFSDAFNLTYTDKNGKRQAVIMGCYGVGVSRIVGILAEIFHDDRGLIWSDEVSPFKVHFLSLGTNEVSNEIYKTLKKEKIEVLYDDRNVSFGAKFVDADLIGCTYRLLAGKNYQAGSDLELQKRDTGKTETLSLDKVITILKS